MPNHLLESRRLLSGSVQQRGGANSMMGARRTIRHLVRILSTSAIGAALIFSVATCNNQSGFSGSVGNTPNGPPLPSFQILGTVGTPFTSTVQGNVPLDTIICNVPNDSVTKVIATKTSNDNSLLSLEIIRGNKVHGLQSTSAPFGTVSEQAGGTLLGMPSMASPDLRIFVSGPLNERYSAFVEDLTTAFVVESRAPTLVLFDTPNGKVDATFFGGQDFGTFTVNMTLNGQVVASMTKGPNATIREP